MREGVSVIICCYNSSSRIEKTLEYLFRQQTSAHLVWEIILVDNASTDQTKEMALRIWKDFGRAEVPLIAVDQPIKGLSNARSKGIEQAQYSVIIFCDDDNWLQADYCQKSFDLVCSHSAIGALGGVGMATSDQNLPEWFDKYAHCYACFKQGDIDGELTDPLSTLFGAGLVIKREVFNSLKKNAFQPILSDRIGNRLSSGGDTELSYAIRLLGYKLMFSGELKFQHYIPSARLTLSYLQRLVASLSYCSGELIVYRYVLTHKTVSNMTWVKDFIYQLVFFFGSLLNYLSFKAPIHERKLAALFAYYRLKSILFQFNKYRVRYQQISSLKKDLPFS